MTNENRLIYRPDGELEREDFVETSLVRGRRLTRYLLRVLQGTGGVIAGGYARWAASPRREPGEFRDVDVFCENEVALARVRCALETFGHPLVRENTVSFIHSGSHRWIGPSVPPINVIKPVDKGRVYTRGGIYEVLHNFDFTICKAGILDESKGLVHFAFHDDEKARRLRFTRIHTPITGVVRAIKYSRKGYKISLRELMRCFDYWDSQKKSFRNKVKKILHIKPGRDFFGADHCAPSLMGGESDIDRDVIELEDAYNLMLIGMKR